MTPPTAPICAAVVLHLFMGSAAGAQPREETETNPWDAAWAELIARELPDFADLTSDEEIRAVVAKAIGSGTPETIEKTLPQIGYIAFFATMEDLQPDIPDDFAELHPRLEPLRQQLSTVRGLREHLMDYVRNGAEETRHWTKTELEQASRSDHKQRQLISWGMAELALAAYFPQDPVVHDFLIDWWRRGDSGGRVVLLLYTGRFRSDAADEIRIASLESAGPRDAVAAAKGLALAGSNAGLAALVMSLDRRDFALQTIVEAIATYGARARIHVDSLIDFREELEAFETDDHDPHVLDSWRKRLITETTAELFAQFEP